MSAITSVIIENAKSNAVLAFRYFAIGGVLAYEINDRFHRTFPLSEEHSFSSTISSVMRGTAITVIIFSAILPAFTPFSQESYEALKELSSRNLELSLRLGSTIGNTDPSAAIVGLAVAGATFGATIRIMPMVVIVSVLAVATFGMLSLPSR